MVLINGGIILLLLLCDISGYINPKISSVFFYLCYGFPLIALINIAFFIYWIINRSKFFLLPVIGFLLTFNTHKVWFPVHFGTEEISVVQEKAKKPLKILTYNVRGLTADVKDENPVIKYILSYNADIICLQEQGGSFQKELRTNKKLRKKFGRYPYISRDDKNHKSVMILSKYPLKKSSIIKYSNETFNASSFNEIDVNGKILRVINNHFESNRLNRADKKDYYKSISTIDAAKFSKVTGKVESATVIRANQADSVASAVGKNPVNTIVCGDFNDIPGSYVYRKVKGDLIDCWVEKASGWGNTYNQDLFLYRIDYILHSKDIRILKIERGDEKYSDHYPLIATILL